MLPLHVRVDLVVMLMKEYSAFPKSPGASPSDCSMSYTGHSLGEFDPSAGIQSVYSTGLAHWIEEEWVNKEKLF